MSREHLTFTLEVPADSIWIEGAFDDSFVKTVSDINKNELEIKAKKQTFETWLLSKKNKPEKEIDKKSSFYETFKQAEQLGTEQVRLFATLSESILGSVGKNIMNLISAAGSCGPLCLHALNTVATLNPVAVSSGLTNIVPGFSVDGKTGMFRLEGQISSLSKATGLTPQELITRQYTVDELTGFLASSFGESVYACCFGLVEVMLDTFLPTTYIK